MAPPFNSFTAASNEWVRLTVKLNYASRKWELYAAHAKPGSGSVCVARDLDFVTGSTNVWAGGFSIMGDGPTPVYFDNLSITTANAILNLLSKGTLIQFQY